MSAAASARHHGRDQAHCELLGTKPWCITSRDEAVHLGEVDSEMVAFERESASPRLHRRLFLGLQRPCTPAATTPRPTAAPPCLAYGGETTMITSSVTIT